MDPLRAPLKVPLAQSLWFVDPKLTVVTTKPDLSKQVSDLQKRLERMEKLLEKSLLNKETTRKRQGLLENAEKQLQEAAELKLRQLEDAKKLKATKKRLEDVQKFDDDVKKLEKAPKKRLW